MDEQKDIDIKLHELKTWPEYFKAVSSGEKTFEIRKNDRDFQVGDYLYLREFDPAKERFTGYHFARQITYVLPGGQFGLEPGYVALGIKRPD